MGVIYLKQVLFDALDDERKAENAAFGGESALHVMLGGDLKDIVRVRRYLDAECAGE